MDLYQVLGVDRKATPEEIRKAYRKKSRELHPDANPGDELAATRFDELAQAHKVLSDPEHRSHYDQTGYTRKTTGGEANPYSKILWALVEVIVDAAGKNRGAGTFDMLAECRGVLRKKVKELQDQVVGLKKCKSYLELGMERTTVDKGEDNMVVRVMEEQIEIVKKDLAITDAEIRQCNAAHEILLKHHYRFEKSGGLWTATNMMGQPVGMPFTMKQIADAMREIDSQQQE